MDHDDWPSLRLADWEPTYRTLHRWAQVVGKVRLALESALNHWWHVTLAVDDRGLTTRAMPFGHRHVSLTLDLCAHRFVAHTSDRRMAGFALEPMTVADFYAKVRTILERLEVHVHIWPVPVELSDATPFTADREHNAYDRLAVERLHRALLSVDRVFSLHRGRFVGKTSPVQLFWGAFDLAVTRFSGRRNPSPPLDPVMKEAYSHEVISHGFWPGGDWYNGARMSDAVFYAYAIPEPDGFSTARLEPREAYYAEAFREIVLPYEVVRSSADPDQKLLAFMESTYLAAATRAGWDIEGLRHAG